MRNMIKRGVLLAAMAICGGAFAHEGYNGLTYSISDEIRQGEMTSRFIKAKEYAEANHVPMLVFWGESSCGICNGFEKAIAAEPKFYEWLAERQYIMTFNIDYGTKKEYGLYSDDNNKAEVFTRPTTKLPTMAIYWPKEDGTQVLLKFPGRPDYMPQHSAEFKEGGRVFQLMRNMDYYCGDYTSYDGGAFTAPDEPYNRLECADGTETVPVEIVRKAGVTALTETLEVISADGSVTNTVDLNWAAGDKALTNAVPVKDYAFAKDGEQLTLNVKDATNGVRATTHITYVKRANSASNPYWKKADLAFGEWTMDLEAAKALAGTVDGGTVLVSVQGSLWCPDCANTDRNFLDVEDKEGNNLFKKWAVENNVALATVDIPKFNSHGSADGVLTNFTDTTCKEPTLLSRVAMATQLARPSEFPQSGAPEALTNFYSRSGLGYQTRNGITEAEATAALEANWRLATTDMSEGGFHAPTDNWLNRTGVPIFVLMKPDGTVVARFTSFANVNVSPMKADQAKFDAYIARFDEMLEIAANAENLDAGEGGNVRPSVHSAAFAANGGEIQGRLSHVDTVDTFLLKGMGGNATQKVEVKGAADDETRVKVSLLSADALTTQVAFSGGKYHKWAWTPFAYGAGTLKDGVSVSYDFDKPGDYYVMVEAETPDAAPFKVDSETSTFRTYTLKGSIVLIPTAAKATANAPEGSNKVDIRLTTNTLYRLTGLDKNSLVGLTPVAGTEDVYEYIGAAGETQLTLASLGGAIDYQIWEPAKVGFQAEYATLPAKKTTEKSTTITRKESDEIVVTVRRFEGLSGAVKAEIRLNKELSTFFYDYAIDPEGGDKEIPRFKIDGASEFVGENPVVKTIEWADGMSLEECTNAVVLTMRETETEKVQSFFGNGCVVLDFVLTEETEAGQVVVENGRFTVNYTEDQTAKPGKSAFIATDRAWAKKATVYARENEAVQVQVARVENDENPAWTWVKSNVAGVEMACDAGDWGEFIKDRGLLVGWDNHNRDLRNVTVTNLPPAGKSVKLTFSAETKGFGALAASNSVTIVSVAADAPEFETSAVSEKIYRYVAVSNLYKVINTDGGVLSFTKLSGSLPAGLSVKYDAENQAMAVVGVPTATDKATGVKDFEVVYQVTEQREVAGKKTKVPGMIITLAYSVIDPQVTGGEDGAPLNTSCQTARTYKDVIFISTNEIALGEGSAVGRELLGTMQLTIPSKGNASAKLVCALGTISFSASSWDKLGAEDVEGTLRATLRSKDAKYAEYYLEVYALPEVEDGVVVRLTTPSEKGLHRLLPGQPWSKDNKADAYQGYFTVSMAEGKVLRQGKFNGYAPEGAGYLTLKMSDVKTGTMKWAGMLANGTAVSGSAVLSLEREWDGEAEANCAWLPILKSSKTDYLAGVASIDENAKANAEAETDPCYKAVKTAAVYTEDDELEYVIPTVWEHIETAATAGELDYAFAYDLRGSYYDATLKTVALDCCCKEFHLTTNMLVTAWKCANSETYGALSMPEPESVVVQQAGMSVAKGSSIALTFNKSTGIVSGTFKIGYGEAGKTLAAKYQGIIALGWGNRGECELCGKDVSLPFVNGAWYFDDKVDYAAKGGTKSAKVKRGGLLTFEPDVETDPE